MNSRGLTIAVVVLAALTGVLYWSQHRKPAEDTAALSSNATPVVLRISAPDVTALEIKSKGAEPVSLKKTDSGKWEISEPKPYPADQDAVTAMLASLSVLNGDRVVEEKAADRKQYGLDAPAVELDITQKGKGTRRLLIGDDTPAGGDAYAALASEPKVFAVASYNKSSLNKGLNDLRDKTLISLNPDKVSRVALLQKGRTIEFDRTKDGWQILKPSSAAADSDAVNELVRTVSGAKMDLAASDAPAQFAHGTPVATAKLTGDAGTQTLDVRKNKTDFYAKSSLVDGTYKVDSSVGQALDKKFADFEQKKQPLAAGNK
ncbi:MAG: DUF4340 domain-containing protein [Acidobacteriaceae bacterium]